MREQAGQQPGKAIGEPPEEPSVPGIMAGQRGPN